MRASWDSLLDAGEKRSHGAGSTRRRSLEHIVWRGASEACECLTSQRERIESRFERIGESPGRLVDRAAWRHRSKRQRSVRRRVRLLPADRRVARPTIDQVISRMAREGCDLLISKSPDLRWSLLSTGRCGRDEKIWSCLVGMRQRA